MSSELPPFSGNGASRPGILVIEGPLTVCDVPRLCERVRTLLCDADATVVVCDVHALAADALTIETLARMQLTARRLGRTIRIQRASDELDRLLAFVGLDEVLVGDAAS
jgi:ABC-type transporter Mla MlaB component